MFSKSAFFHNLSWIFIGNVVHAILQFLVNIIAARILTTEDLGTINYTASLIAFFTTIGTLGFNHTITMHYTEDEEKAGIYTGTAIISRIVVAVLAIVVIQIVIKIIEPQKVVLSAVAFCQSTSILFAAFDSYIYWFRFKNQANIVAVGRLAAFFLSASIRVVVLFTTKSIVWYVSACSLEVLAYSLFLSLAYIKGKNPKLAFDRNMFLEMLKLSYPFIFSALLMTIYGQTDKIMLRVLLDIDSVAFYSVSLVLAGVISIIPIALIDGFRPEIMKSKIKNKVIYEKRFRQLYCIVFWICVCYGIVISLFARPIILMSYGSKYLPAIPSLATVVWYTSFSYFGAINNIYMVCENKTSYVQMTALLGAGTNIALNYVLIPAVGVVGAAAASLITQIAINFLLLAVLSPLRPCFKLMLDGILFRDVFDFRKRKIN